MTDFERARRVMVENQLRTSNVTDRRVLNAMGRVPREMFVPEPRQGLAYIDESHKLATATGAERFLAAPAPFARLVQLAGVQTKDKVLDLACASGYSTAILADLAASVVGVEADPLLASAALRNLAELGVNNAVITEGPVETGAPNRAPFDVIMLEGAVETVPKALFAQLREGGRLVALISSGRTAVANLFVKAGNDVAARAEFNASLPPFTDEIVATKFEF